ncbi:hypothetical protein ACP6IV_004585, partial [Enterobacter hormaechei]
MVIAEDMRTWSMASFESGWRCSFFVSELIAMPSCQQRVKSDPLTATTNGLILIHLVYSGLASA